MRLSRSDQRRPTDNHHDDYLTPRTRNEKNSKRNMLQTLAMTKRTRENTRQQETQEQLGNHQARGFIAAQRLKQAVSACEALSVGEKKNTGRQTSITQQCETSPPRRQRTEPVLNSERNISLKHGTREPAICKFNALKRRTSASSGVFDFCLSASIIPLNRAICVSRQRTTL